MSGSCTVESLFSTEVNGTVYNKFTWVVFADETTIKLAHPDAILVTYNIVSVDCNVIVFELLGYNVELTRK